MSLRQATCRSCGAPIVWMQTNTGKNIPVDPDGVDEAELTLEDGKPLFEPTNGHIAHFATCPHADQHRRS